MSQSQNRMICYAVAGVCALVLLILVGRLALREPPVPAGEHPATVATAPPRTPHVTPPFSPADDSSPEATVNRPNESATTNAAAIYRQAFALYDALSQQERYLVSDWRTNVDASVEAELCEKVRPICELMHKAATLTNCDWGLEQPITYYTKVPHLAPCRAIARAAVWSAAHCRADDPAGAIDDLVASSRLGQKLLDPPTLIDHLVDLAIQNMVIDAVTEHASTLAGAGDTRLVQLFSDAQYDDGLYRGIKQSADIMSSIADLFAAMPPEEAMDAQKKLVRDMGGDDSKWQSMDPQQAIADLRRVADFEREYANMLSASDAEYSDWLARLEAARNTNPFVGMDYPLIENAVDRTQAMTVRSAMVVAGLVVMQNGPDALQSHPDPVTGQQFTYAQTADGFELQSSYQFNGQPLKLSFK